MNPIDGLTKEDHAAIASYAAAMIVVACYMLFDLGHEPIPREPSHLRNILRQTHMNQILFGGRTHAYDYFRMDKGPFFNLARMLRNGGSVRDTIHVAIEEQLAMLLHIVGHNAKFRFFSLHFIRSGETVSRYFNVVLSAILKLLPLLMKQAGGDMAEEILNTPTWSPYFKVYYI